MKSATMSNNALKRENTSASANVLMCKQWWKVCWMYGDQEKYYRQLYGKRNNRNLNSSLFNGINMKSDSNVKVSNFYENTINRQHQKSPDNNQVQISADCNRLPSPNSVRTSPELNSLDLTRGIDE